jgi:outer membrane protein assembly factor BamB
MKKLSFLILLLPLIAFGQHYPQLSMPMQNIPAYIQPKTTALLQGLKWKFKTNGKVFSSPAISNGIAYIGSEDHSLYAIDTKTGKRIWEYCTGGAVHSSPSVNKNVVCFGSYDGYYYALNARTGKLLWKFKTGGEKKVGAKGLWTMQPKDEYMDDLYDFFLSSPIFSANASTVYFGSSDGKLYAVSAATGKLKWSFKTGGLIHTTRTLI